MTNHPQPPRSDIERFDNQDSGLPCPCCGEECDRDSVDVGVGIIRGPWGCVCGWSESPEYDRRHGRRRDEHGNLLDQYGGLHPKGGSVDRLVGGVRQVKALTLWQPWASLVSIGEPIKCTDLYPGDEDVDPGMWAWPMQAVEPLEPPVPAKGAQGFWNWSGA